MPVFRVPKCSLRVSNAEERHWGRHVGVILAGVQRWKPQQECCEGGSVLCSPTSRTFDGLCALSLSWLQPWGSPFSLLWPPRVLLPTTPTLCIPQEAFPDPRTDPALHLSCHRVPLGSLPVGCVRTLAAPSPPPTAVPPPQRVYAAGTQLIRLNPRAV